MLAAVAKSAPRKRNRLRWRWAASSVRYPGQYFDAESGLHYNYYRDYEPSTGRYVQSDPIGLEGGINTYGYVLANPLRYTDPQGLSVAEQEAARRILEWGDKALDCMRLRLLVWMSCKMPLSETRRCKGTDDCPTLFAKYELNTDCARFQTLLTERCYAATPSHGQVVQDALNRAARCTGLIDRNCRSCPAQQ